MINSGISVIRGPLEIILGTRSWHFGRSQQYLISGAPESGAETIGATLANWQICILCRPQACYDIEPIVVSVPMKKYFKENAQWASHRQHLCHAQHVFCVVLCVVLCSSIRWHFLCCIIFVLQHDFNTMLLEHASAHRVEVDSEQTSVSMLCVRLYCTHPSRVRNVWQRRFVDLFIFIQHVFNPNGFQKYVQITITTHTESNFNVNLHASILWHAFAFWFLHVCMCPSAFVDHCCLLW